MMMCFVDTTLVSIFNSRSRMSSPAGVDTTAADYASTTPSCHLFCYDLQRLGLSRLRRLGIAGMTTMLSLGTLLWELDGWHWGFQCKSATCHSDTHSAAEGNVSRTLQVTGTHFCDRSSWRARRDKWIPQGGLIFSPCVVTFLFTILSFHIFLSLPFLALVFGFSHLSPQVCHHSSFVLVLGRSYPL